MDRKIVMAMSTVCHPDESGTVPRRMQDGSRIPIPCPESIIRYNKYMGGVDRGDQLRGYYSCRTKSRKFYKYIYTFLLDVAITNSYVLMKDFSPECPFSNYKSFRLQLAKELVGDYCSRRRRGRGGMVIRTLPYRHFPTTMEDESNQPKRKRGRCALHAATHVRATSTWYCRECSVWLCHTGDPSSDCFLKWHTQHHI